MSRAMKDFGVEWIGEIPDDWEVRKLSSIAETITDYVASGSFASLNKNVQYLSEPNYAMLIRTVDLSNKTNKQPIYIDKLAYDFLSNSNLFGGEIILSNIGSVGNVFMYEPMFEHASLAPNSIMVRMIENNRYYYYWFLNPVVNETLKIIGSDTVQAKFNKTQLRKLLVARPSIDEQKKIATFLDDKTAQIDTIIDKTKQSIIEFKKYKQALITETVTKGLNPEAKMKDSGIEWIGEIPEQWHVSKLKRFSNIRYGLGEPPKLSEDGLPIIRATNIERGKIVTNNLIKAKIEDIPSAKDVVLKHGDILIVRSGAYAGDVALVSQEWEGALAGYDMIISLFDINPKFTSYALLSDYILKAQLYLSRMRSAQPHLNAADVGKVQIVVPSLSEQQQIADYLDEKCSHIDSLIADKEKLIREFEDYKKALI